MICIRPCLSCLALVCAVHAAALAQSTTAPAISDRTATDDVREPEKLENLPAKVRETMDRVTSGAADVSYFRLRRAGGDLYAVAYSPKQGQWSEMRVGVDGAVVGLTSSKDDGGGAADEPAVAAAGPVAAATTSPATLPTPPQPQAQPAGARQAPTAGAALDAQPKVVKFAELPDPVKKSFLAETKDALISEYRRGTHDGNASYSVLYTPKGGTRRMELRVDAEGNALEEAREAPEAPSNAAAAN